MEDTTESQSNSASDLNKSTKRLGDGTNSCTTTQISSSDCSLSKTSIVYEYEESVEVKEEIIEERSNSMSDSNKSTARLAAGAPSCTTTHISSSNYSDPKTSTVYEHGESIEIKEEIIEERLQDGEHNHLPEKSELDEKSLSSDEKSAAKTEIVYEYDETLEIKEEVIQDQKKSLRQKIEKKCESTLNTVDTREADILTANKLRTHQKKKIQESETEPGKKYKCQKCARTYKYKHTLNTHKKFVCGLTPQFSCMFCDKRFKLKAHVNRHVDQVHKKRNPNQNKRKVQESKQEPEKDLNMYKHQKTKSNISQACYNCDKCFQSYSSSRALYDHNRLKHAAVKLEFTCDVCGYKTNIKSSLSKHISSSHFKNSKTPEARHDCDQCFKSYSSLTALKLHNRLKHAADKPEFTCDSCGYKTDMKSVLSRHISSRHFKNSETPEARHNCDKCSLNYSSLYALKRHNRLKHATVKPEFTCDVCVYKTDLKSNLSLHILLRHFNNSKTSKVRHNCEKCSRTYSYSRGLRQHKRLKHPR